MTVAHYIPFRAIRAGKQLSDSKGASAAISTEVAIMSMKRSMMGFMGPRDIFRNPEAIFRFFEPTTGGTNSDKNIIDIELANKARWGVGESPFNLVLSHSGSDFAVCGMHFKLGLYEHQSAGAIEGVINLLRDDKHGAGELKSMDDIAKIEITAYEPAFGIIGDPAKKDPKTRQSADHSMAFIVSRIMQKALTDKSVTLGDNNTAWKELMLSPYDYGYDALYDPATRALMQKIQFSHGGKSYDDDYPAGIPTSLKMTLNSGKVLDSGYMMFPTGHANNKTADLDGILDYKAKKMLGPLVFKNDTFGGKYIDSLIAMRGLPDAAGVYGFDATAEMRSDHAPIDGEDGAPYLKLM
jgi:2-methylcitrate dehydratase